MSACAETCAGIRLAMCAFSGATASRGIYAFEAPGRFEMMSGLTPTPPSRQTVKPPSVTSVLYIVSMM